MRKHALVAAAFLLAVPAAAHAEDAKSESEGKLSVNFNSSSGLVGMRDMIDARVPQDFIAARGTLKFHHESLNLDSRALYHSVDYYSADAIGGVSALGILDGGIKLPFSVRVQKDSFHGGPSRQFTVNGVNDAIISGKAGFQLGPWIALGPYASIHWNTGSKALEKTNELHLGGAATVSVLDDRIGLHANLTSVSFTGGKWAFGYRFGASVVPFASDALVLRLFVYMDAKDYIGKRIRGNDARFFGGAQALFFKIVTAEFSFGMKFDAGDLPRGVRDDATYGLDMGGGIALGF